MRRLSCEAEHLIPADSSFHAEQRTAFHAWPALRQQLYRCDRQREVFIQGQSWPRRYTNGNGTSRLAKRKQSTEKALVRQPAISDWASENRLSTTECPTASVRITKCTMKVLRNGKSTEARSRQGAGISRAQISFLRRLRHETSLQSRHSIYAVRQPAILIHQIPHAGWTVLSPRPVTVAAMSVPPRSQWHTTWKSTGDERST
ncbi:hypothetical protein LXA43DRAFT_99434 [Ganoderma leucocontextum]|nr:hypothetical protein LXA43DRAFT_99434 [Ganoderma leucocontextum]